MGTNKQIFQLILSVCLGFFLVNVQALALSDIELKSFLNQKLDARIRLMEASSTDLDGLKVNLTSSYNKNVSHHRLKCELIRGENENFLKITSEDVIQEPIVEFQLDINWPDGRVVREYSLLIDPVGN